MKKRKICLITGSRADYGILSHLMGQLKQNPLIELQIIATNMHLSPEYGMTVTEIEEGGFSVDKKVEMLLSSDTAAGTVKSMGLGMIGFADAFQDLNPDLLIILGDRYEMLSAASAAQIFGIPIAHIHGGEITEGAYDDAIRHAITKLSYLHFTSSEEYKNRVIQMGEFPNRVFNIGSLSLDGINNEERLDIKELENSIGTKLGKNFILVTYHPVTREPGTAKTQITNLLKALEKENRKILFTLPNSDNDGRIISDIIKQWCKENPNRGTAVESLGKKRYFSALSLCGAVIGNSSSGIIEAPSFKVPTLNIGDRQKGRTQGNTVVNCDTDIDSIRSGLKKVLSDDFIKFVNNHGYNPYFKEDSINIFDRIITTVELPKHSKKQFYDIIIDKKV